MENTDEIYDYPEHTWWDDNGDGNLASLSFMNHPINFDRIDAIVSKMIGNNPDNISILDIGCGTSTIPNRHEKVDLEVIGIDFSIEFDVITRPPTKQETISIKQFVGCDEFLPLESDSFDFACCHYPLPCAKDFQRLLNEISRVLKNNGIFFINNINNSSTFNLIVFKILHEYKGVAFPDPTIVEFDLSIGLKGFLKILNDHYLCNQGNDLPSGINYIYHYFNLKKQSRGKECSPRHPRHAEPLPEPFPHHSGEFF